MQLVKTNDFNDVRDAFVTGVASIAETAPGVVRVSYFVEYEESYDGGRQRRIIDSQVWSLPQLADNLLIMLQVLNEMRQAERKPRLALVEGMH